MTLPLPHAAIVLAAGGSVRLGAPKQLLKRGGETLVHRAVRLASVTQPQRLLVVVGAYADEVRDAIADVSVEVLHNDQWEEGLASSLRLAVGSLGDDQSALILGCDQPALDFPHLQRLLFGAAASGSGCAATLHGEARGVPAVVSAAVLVEARDLHGDRGLRGALQRLPTDSIYLMQAVELEFDLDTPGDVEKAVGEGLLD
ncbi:nucleotidyltransferase family protein [Pseudoxanthomonas sacheonensis]|uniref:Molybdenum cofactor cytidylyltransferase n=1 Tax=Pseudoxanthomonas sacheonensis TaxID=443615 RepID=A0ABU1RSG4_9GAMM|nr:nucleotidyltransferase family protein [Pseudoxanthomonas sacheonensis]MDR6841245.1 molybdenum cofactor cytidylyltransferase [Pseudoxanthomonas sacheonensis]